MLLWKLVLNASIPTVLKFARLIASEGENMLVIHPDECIDCGVCEPECPVDAIKPDTEPGVESWIALNAELAAIWPVITEQKDPPADAEKWADVSDKLSLLSRTPGEG